MSYTASNQTRKTTLPIRSEEWPMEVAAKRNARPPKQSLRGINEKQKNTATLRMCADFSYSSLRSELFSALHARQLTGDRNDAQRHFLAFVVLLFFVFKKTVKKMVCFPSELKCLKLLKSENFANTSINVHIRATGGNCEPFSVCTRFSGCYLALKWNVWSIRWEQKDGDCWLCMKGQKSSIFHFALLRLDPGKANQSASARTLCDALDTGKSSFALCWCWHPSKNVVVRCTGGDQQRRRYGGEGQLAGCLTLRLEHLLGKGSKRTRWHQPRQTLPVSYPLSALIFSMFSVLFFIQSKNKNSKTKQKKSIKTKNNLEGKKAENKTKKIH